MATNTINQQKTANITSTATVSRASLPGGNSDQSLKLAVAISLLRSKLLQRQQPAPHSDAALRWKRKAKERKQELHRVREDLKEAQDASHSDIFPQGAASCKCYFFDNLGKIISDDASHHRFSDVLRRRFLRQVRLRERKRTDGSKQRKLFSDLNGEDEAEQLRASVDFLVELYDSTSPVPDANFANWSHQAVDFILASLRNLQSRGKYTDFTEEIVNSLIMRLIRRMCSSSQGDGSLTDTDTQFHIQHLIRKLGSEAYIGQRALISVSQRISVVAENLLFMDPFDEAFPNLHRCLYIMIQLIEFLVSDYLMAWSKDEGFDNVLFEEWMITLLHARKGLGLLESRNGLYALYMDRITGQLAKQVYQVPSFQKLNQDILDTLLC
ncbi:protein MULTIPOLAR SPINDLE 1 [Mercurialis annua]|uniref:protein MULTIPOLAR SPINDLE 1 n=1 Tax=Mercurialis annua TaxID=3986 RepID=UPI00215F00FD|nr:protein MULTIPOLAR SPINDLE 1 [Mercurialis annua]XP_050214107.1 protein MULTIPOLAR SPINDLE 1 [Mercurialis annua]XP_050214108.1 protein MULTIPOLAR SPINDLE 1 [Mercurialis annua]XP_050214109.1 protein MULTIPOLAR SPINDLE 1 [Mercurialis annua]